MSAGSMRQRGSSWELKWDLERGPGGRRRTRTTSFRGTKKEAQAKLRELLAAADRGQHVDPSRLTVAALVAERIALWLATGKISAKTAERRDQLLRGQIGRIGGIQAQRLSTIDLEQWHVGMIADGLAPRTIRDAHSLLALALDQAVKHRLVPSNAARLQKAPKVPDEEVEIVRAEEIDATLAKLGGNPFYAAVIVALYTGVRRSEMLALIWDDVKFDAKTLRVERALEETKAGIVIKPPKTLAGRRDISLPGVVVETLRTHRRQQLELRMALGMGKMPEDALVFPGHDFGHQSPRNFTTSWSRTVVRLGLPRVTWHAWRHTHASMLIDRGVPIATIAKRMGHKNPSITLQTYAHCYRENDRAAADAIDALAGG